MAQAKAPAKTASKAPTKPKPPATPAKWTHGRVFWNELMTHDIAKAKAFYTATLGWTFEAMPMDYGTYWIVKTGGEMVGGMFEMTDADLARMPDQWVAYIAVDDVEARLQKATSAGAKVMREPFEIKGVGRSAILREPGGAMIHWITPNM